MIPARQRNAHAAESNCCVHVSIPGNAEEPLASESTRRESPIVRQRTEVEEGRRQRLVERPRRCLCPAATSGWTNHKAVRHGRSHYVDRSDG